MVVEHLPAAAVAPPAGDGDPDEVNVLAETFAATHGASATAPPTAAIGVAGSPVASEAPMSYVDEESLDVERPELPAPVAGPGAGTHAAGATAPQPQPAAARSTALPAGFGRPDPAAANELQRSRAYDPAAGSTGVATSDGAEGWGRARGRKGAEPQRVVRLRLGPQVQALPRRSTAQLDPSWLHGRRCRSPLTDHRRSVTAQRARSRATGRPRSPAAARSRSCAGRPAPWRRPRRSPRRAAARAGCARPGCGGASRAAAGRRG